MHAGVVRISTKLSLRYRFSSAQDYLEVFGRTRAQCEGRKSNLSGQSLLQNDLVHNVVQSSAKSDECALSHVVHTRKYSMQAAIRQINPYNQNVVMKITLVYLVRTPPYDHLALPAAPLPVGFTRNFYRCS